MPPVALDDVMVDRQRKRDGGSPEEQRRKALLLNSITEVCDFGGPDLPNEVKQLVHERIWRSKPVFDFSVAAHVLKYHLRNERKIACYLPDGIRKMYSMNGAAGELDPAHTRSFMCDLTIDIRNKWIGAPTMMRQVDEMDTWLRRWSANIDYEKIKRTEPERSYIWFKNGVFDFAIGGGTFRPLAELDMDDIEKHFPPIFIIPHDYDVNWKQIDGHKVDAFFSLVVPDLTQRTLLLETAAGALVPSLVMRTLFLVGTGSNGKGVVLELLRRTVGPENTSAVSFTDMNTNKFAAHGLVGKCLNIVSEDPSEGLSNTSAFRTLATQEALEVEQKYRERYMLYPIAKHMFAVNMIPTVEDLTNAFLRRIGIVDFPRCFVGSDWDDVKTFKANPHFIEEFTEEDYQYLLGEFIELLRYRVTAPPTPPNLNEMDKIYEEYERKSNTVLVFFADVFSPANEEVNAKVAQPQAYAAYKKWCRERTATCQGRHKFAKKAKEVVECGRSHGVNWFLNLTVKAEWRKLFDAEPAVASIG